MAQKFVPFVGDIEVFQTPDRGRGVRCTADIPKGTTILREECLSAVLDEDAFGQYCDYCLTRPSDGKVRRCVRCLDAGYCSKACQTNAWKAYHKKECERLKQCASPIYSPDARFVVRSLIATNLEEEEAYDDKNFPLTVQQLYFDPSQSVRARARLRPIARPVDTNRYTAEQMCKMVSVVERNSFSLFWEVELLPYGVGLCQRASLINHHCQPNCRRTSHGRFLDIRSIRDLKKGEEVYIPYTRSKLATTEERQRLLQTDRDFTCGCSLCEDPTSDLVLRCITCQTKKCKGFLKMESGAEAKCTVCGHTLYNTDDRWLEMMEEEREIRGLLKFEDKSGMRRKLLDRSGGILNPRILHPNHYLVVEARSFLVRALLSQQETEAAMKLERENLEALRYQHSPYDRALLNAYMTLGNEHSHGDIGEGRGASPLADLQCSLRNVKISLEMYSKIMEIIRVTHDEKNPLHGIVRERIQQLKKNVDWTTSLIRRR